MPRLSPRHRFWISIVGLLSFVGSHAEPYVPNSDDVIVETLPFKLFPPKRASQPNQSAASSLPVNATVAEVASDPHAAARIAREYLQQARDRGDPHFVGYALASLKPWRGDAEARAPAEIVVILATLDQYQHDFIAARERLTRLLARTREFDQGIDYSADPAILQALLTLATIDRVLGRYADSDHSCHALSVKAPLYAQACSAENAALRGETDAARREIEALLALPLIRDDRQRGTRRWFLTTLAELEERAGRNAAAGVAYRHALATLAKDERDSYLLFAYADFLLGQNRPAEALHWLAHEPEPVSDGALLRQAIAEKALRGKEADLKARQLAQELAERFDAARLRGDGANKHGRELARFELWVQGDAQLALRDARENLKVQREPADVLIMAQAAHAAGDAEALRETAALLASQGLVDARVSAALAQALAASSTRVSSAR